MKQKRGKYQVNEELVFKRINKVGKPLEKLTERKRSILMKLFLKGDITTDAEEIQRLKSTSFKNI